MARCVTEIRKELNNRSFNRDCRSRSPITCEIPHLGHRDAANRVFFFLLFLYSRTIISCCKHIKGLMITNEETPDKTYSDITDVSCAVLADRFE